jgi:hypothetical protein
VIPIDRDASTADALLTDLYLDSILAVRRLRGGGLDEPQAFTPRSAPIETGRLDPAVRAASDRLRHDLVRVHPSFRFEERLATRLAEVAFELRLPTAVGAEGRVVPFRAPSSVERSGTSHLEDPESTDPDAERRDLSRPLLIGGALTSAALSIAGAALVAWRRTRPGSPMARAARAIRDARLSGGSGTDGVASGSSRLD